ncbi:hypothetical protein Pmani_009769 [Petrolisthes manimaculis]|uniref:Uncharacterized protein n=1 Tax=Petrolisthes manimaculis TaxID=1843537 RepID=A0AAE1UHI4_9EUCA|nr:hypothetical protein Pmani_009769 [Petrolisthes manimaculis]
MSTPPPPTPPPPTPSPDTPSSPHLHLQPLDLPALSPSPQPTFTPTHPLRTPHHHPPPSKHSIYLYLAYCPPITFNAV